MNMSSEELLVVRCVCFSAFAKPSSVLSRSSIEYVGENT